MSKLESQSDSEPKSEEQTLESHTLDHALLNIKHVPEDYLNVLTQTTSKNYLIKITLVFSEDYKLETIILFDTSVDLNCIKEGVVSK